LTFKSAGGGIEGIPAQMGEDARNASAAHGEEGIAQVVDHLAQTIDAFLNEN